ncbi:hypothetical protein RBSH_02667 [Rhodopirellula baltica SH28]|uniref:Uncharacterized protein n=1 Tax=Rhodopirellula baltica SH28 TaxID=993517 RepID=K5DHT5_RHOBT|nr:hypothetical protein RBSH_02667 [Rhodopirellula baltica SH28]
MFELCPAQIPTIHLMKCARRAPFPGRLKETDIRDVWAVSSESDHCWSPSVSCAGCSR